MTPLDIFEARMERISGHYVTLIGQHINDIGHMTATDIHRLEEMSRMNKNISKINGEVANLVGMTKRDMRLFLVQEVINQYGSWAAAGIQTIKDQELINRLFESLLNQTNGVMTNLSNTTVVSQAYKDAIDDAATAVQLGYTDYNSAVRGALKNVSKQGLRVQYASGLTRRLDTALRQNITNSVRQINQQTAFKVGEVFGADGVEISAHGTCAEDHLPYQGKQYSMEQFNKLQRSLYRKIGEWNCRHTISPIILGISEPAWSDAQLRQLEQYSNKQITIGGKTLSRYQWSQEMRKMETEMRYAKDEANIFKASGDDVGRRNAQAKINALSDAYSTVSRQTGLPKETKRATVSQFKPVFKIEDEKLKQALSRVVKKYFKITLAF